MSIKDWRELSRMWHQQEMLPCFWRFSMKSRHICLKSRHCVWCTVPFHSIQQSHITGPSKMLKCHGCHGDFYGVPNSFGNHVSNIENFSSPAVLNCRKFPKIWVCHDNFGRLPKPNFRQACHASWALPNWLKWYSKSLSVLSHILQTKKICRHGNTLISLESSEKNLLPQLEAPVATPTPATVRGVWLPRIQVDSRVAIFDRHPSLIYMYIHNYGDTHQCAYLWWWLEW